MKTTTAAEIKKVRIVWNTPGTIRERFVEPGKVLDVAAKIARMPSTDYVEIKPRGTKSWRMLKAGKDS